MRDRSRVVLSEAYGQRLAAQQALMQAAGARGGNPAALRTAAAAFDETAATAADPKVATAHAAFSDALRIAALLVEWRAGVLDATPEADRFLRSVVERVALWQQDHSGAEEASDVGGLVGGLGDESTLASVGPFCRNLGMVPLPICVRGRERPPTEPDLSARFSKESDKDTREELAVAFVAFTVDEEPASDVQFLTPHEAHDLEIEVRVSRWPDDATELCLTPLSIEAPGAYELPDFRFAKPLGEPPFRIRQRGRAIIKAAQALRARPFEFRYAAEFAPKASEQPVSVVGHRTLRIESVDVRSSPLTGYPAVDRRLLELRNDLRRTPGLSQADLGAAVELLVPLASLAARAVQDSLFPKQISEADFQRVVRDELRRHPSIGAELEEHAHAAGGETDLGLRGVRLELKAQSARRLQLSDCESFLEQTSAYAVGSGKNVGMLCVLDTSLKTDAPMPVEQGLGLFKAPNGVLVVTVLVQGGLPRPSDLSRKPRRAKRA